MSNREPLKVLGQGYGRIRVGIEQSKLNQTGSQEAEEAQACSGSRDNGAPTRVHRRDPGGNRLGCLHTRVTATVTRWQESPEGSSEAASLCAEEVPEEARGEDRQTGRGCGITSWN